MVTVIRRHELGAVALLLLGASCTRPIGGRDGSHAVVTSVRVVPPFVRAGVAVDVSALIVGELPTKVTFALGPLNGPCPTQPASDLRTHCGISPAEVDQLAQGLTTVTVQATDHSGRTSSLTSTLTIDLQCPHLTRLSVNPPIASEGQQVLIDIEADEPLGQAPQMQRDGVPWEEPIGGGSSYTAAHTVGPLDTSGTRPIVVTGFDRAGNALCDSPEPQAKLTVARGMPVIDGTRILLDRGVPGQSATISGTTGAVLSDVPIQSVRVLSFDGALTLASPEALADGSIAPTLLNGFPSGRVVVEATDMLGRTSTRATVTERWLISVGAGAAPGSAVRTAARWTAPAPSSAFMENHTIDFAPAVNQADARVADVRARLGFVPSGRLPNFYENTQRIIAGYDAHTHAAIAFGGLVQTGTAAGAHEFFSRTLVLRWNESTFAYDYEDAQLTTSDAPTEREGTNLAFDGQGCGIMFGGFGLDPDLLIQDSPLNDLWQLCSGPSGYTWTRIDTTMTPARRMVPIAYSPTRHAYFVSAGLAYNGDIFNFDPSLEYFAADAYLLHPGASAGATWSFQPIAPPAGFVGRIDPLVFYDPPSDSFVVGLGGVDLNHVAYDRSLDWWINRSTGWTSLALPVASGMGFRQGFGQAYDLARKQLVLWGDDGEDCIPTPCTDVSPLLNVLSGTATSAASGWSWVDLDAPVARAWPAMLYDEDRELVIAFGGLRYDSRFISPDIYSVVTEPSRPYLQATIDLGAKRPSNVQRLSLTLRAVAQGASASAAPDDGVIVSLYDWDASAWQEVARDAGRLEDGPQPINVVITSSPARFVSPDGIVALTFTSKSPASRTLDGHLLVDLIQGSLGLSP
jgi:hypothetical protein